MAVSLSRRGTLPAPPQKCGRGAPPAPPAAPSLRRLPRPHPLRPPCPHPVRRPLRHHPLCAAASGQQLRRREQGSRGRRQASALLFFPEAYGRRGGGGFHLRRWLALWERRAGVAAAAAQRAPAAGARVGWRRKQAWPDPEGQRAEVRRLVQRASNGQLLFFLLFEQATVRCWRRCAL
ncbi:unnamed protein product [Urochloa humidicola]